MLELPSLTAKDERVDDLYRGGSQIDLEEALEAWLQKEINRLEAQGGEPVNAWCLI